MKPKFRSLIAAFAPLSRSSLIVCASLCAAGSASAAKTWTGATNVNWATATNWVEGAIPGTGDTVNFNANSLLNLGINLGATREIRGISLVDPAGPVTISNNALTLRDVGINMSTATQDLTINPVVTFYSAQHNLNVAAGRTLTLANVPVRNTGANNDNVGAVVRIGTTGTVKIGTSARAAILDGGQNLNPFVTYGDDAWAATDATGTVIPATDAVWTASVGTAFGAGPAAVSGSFTQSGNGGFEGVTFKDTTTAHTLTLTSSTTFTGRGVLMTSSCVGGTINGGFFRPNRVSTAGASIAIIQNSTIGDLTIGSNLANASGTAPATVVAMSKAGPGKLILTGNCSYAGRTFIHSGTLQLGNGGITGGLSAISLQIFNNGSLIVDRSNDITLANVISGTGTLTKNGAGTLILGNANSYTGATTVNGGLVSIGAATSFGATSGITLNGGGVRWTAAADISLFPVTIGATGTTFDTNGIAVTLANSIGNSGTGAVTKSGAGSLTVTGDNLYSGGTTVSAGSLIVNNVSGSGTGSGAVSVASSAALGGTGTISGAVTVASGGNLGPGASVGTLTVGGLVLDSGSTGTFEFNNTPSNDAVAVAPGGNLTINGGAITLLDVTGSPIAFTTPGTYDLISHTSATLGAGVTSLSVANAQPGFSYSFADTGTMVTLTIATAGAVRQWNYDGSDSWNTATRWTPNTAPDGPGATANFTTFLTAPAAVTLDGNKTVGALVFLSGANAYTIAQGTSGSLIMNNGVDPATITNNDGYHIISAPITLTSNIGLSTAAADDSTTLSGLITGTATLTKTGPGTLSLLGNNTLFSGLVTLSGGATTFANGGLGTGNLTVSGSLVWNTGNTQDISDRTITFGANPVTFDTNGNNVEIASAIGNSGTAAFTKAGSGKLTFTADPTFTGNVTISGGILQLGNGGATGLVSGAITNNAELEVNLADGAILSNPIGGTGTFVHAGTGALALDAVNTFSGTTTIPSVTATLVLGNSLSLQNSTLQYDSAGSPTPTAGGSLSFGTLAAATLGGLSGNKDLVLENTTPAAVALTVGGNGASTDYSGALSGTGSLLKTGAGTLILSGANTYSGATSCNGGILEVTGGNLGTTAAAINLSAGGRLTVSDGAVAASQLNVGGHNTGGAFNVNFGSVNVAGNINSSDNDTTNIQLTGGTVAAGGLVLQRTANGPATTVATGLPAGAISTAIQVDGSDVTLGAISIGTSNSSATLRVNSGSVAASGVVLIGANSGSSRCNYLNVNGGTFTSTEAVTGIQIGKNVGTYGNVASLYLTGGVTTSEIITFGASTDTVANQSYLTLNGGTLYVGSGGIVRPAVISGSNIFLVAGTLGAKANWSSSLPVSLTGAATIEAADETNNPFNITLSGAVAGAGELTKTGGGILTLNGVNNYTGSTTVTAGTLSLGNDDVLNDTAPVDVASGATLNLNHAGTDTVGAFLIDGVDQGSGTFGGTGSGANHIIPQITGTGLLYVVPTSQYLSWTTDPANGLTAGVNDGPNQDPDNDGIENQLEFVLGGNPMVSSTGILPKLTVNATDFIFSFTRNDDSEAEVALNFQSGTDLSGWAPIAIGAANSAGVLVDEGTPATNPDTITVTISRGSNTKLFGRLQAVKTP